MDESQHIALAPKEMRDEKGDMILKNKVTEIFRYQWSAEEKAFMLHSSNNKESVKHVIPQEEVREVGLRD